MTLGLKVLHILTLIEPRLSRRGFQQAKKDGKEVFEIREQFPLNIMTPDESRRRKAHQTRFSAAAHVRDPHFGGLYPHGPSPRIRLEC